MPVSTFLDFIRTLPQGYAAIGFLGKNTPLLAPTSKAILHFEQLFKICFKKRNNYSFLTKWEDKFMHNPSGFFLNGCHISTESSHSVSEFQSKTARSR